MCTIERYHVNTNLLQGCRPVEQVFGNTECGTNKQTPHAIFNGIGIVAYLQNIAVSDQPYQKPIFINNGEFSILYWRRMRSAFLISVPCGAVMRFSVVITSLTFIFTLVSKRRSRLVRMPTSFFIVVNNGDAADFVILH